MCKLSSYPPAAQHHLVMPTIFHSPLSRSIAISHRTTCCGQDDETDYLDHSQEPELQEDGEMRSPHCQYYKDGAYQNVPHFLAPAA